MPQILLVDDDPEAVEWLSEFIRAEGYTVGTADSLRAARIHLTRSRPEVILTDLVLPDGQGTELVNDIEAGDAPEVVVITGHASIESAIDALRGGATDYLIKPVDVERLRSILQRIPKVEHFRQEIGQLRGELLKLGRFGHILGSSPAMRRVYDQIARVAPTSASVLLVGESGTGKEVVAQTIHELSRRKRQPFLIRMREGRPFAFAGLWEPPSPGEAAPAETCTILTVEPNPLLRPIHDRMPAILAPEDYARWLEPGALSPAVQGLLRPYPAEAMACWPVGPQVNDAKHEGPECAAPLRA